jgi:hypothetical protein
VHRPVVLSIVRGTHPVRMCTPTLFPHQLFLPPAGACHGHSKTMHSAHRVYSCVLYGSDNKQWSFRQTALTGWALWWRRGVCSECAHFLVLRRLVSTVQQLFRVNGFYTVAYLHSWYWRWVCMSQYFAVLVLFSNVGTASEYPRYEPSSQFPKPKERATCKNCFEPWPKVDQLGNYWPHGTRSFLRNW